MMQQGPSSNINHPIALFDILYFKGAPIAVLLNAQGLSDRQ